MGLYDREGGNGQLSAGSYAKSEFNVEKGWLNCFKVPATPLGALAYKIFAVSRKLGACNPYRTVPISNDCYIMCEAVVASSTYHSNYFVF